MAPSPRFALRVEPEVLEAWKMAAGIEGLSVAKWLHEAAADRIKAAKLPERRPVMPRDTPEDKSGSEIAPEGPDSAPETPETADSGQCEHRNVQKLAYMTRCADCGTRIR